MGNEPSLIRFYQANRNTGLPPLAFTGHAQTGCPGFPVIGASLYRVYSAGSRGCFLIPGSAPGNVSSQHVKKRPLPFCHGQVGMPVTIGRNGFQFLAADPFGGHELLFAFGRK